MATSTGHVSLIVKGPIKNARRAAQRHSITLRACTKVGPELQCYVSCSPSLNRNVVDWFSDRARTKPGRGHPPGTLLYHGSLCETDFGRRRKKTRKRRR